MAAAVDAGAHDAAATAMDVPSAVTASGTADLVPLYEGTLTHLRANFDAACALHPDLIVRWEDVLPAVTEFVNTSHKAGSDEAGKAAAAQKLATILSTLPRREAAPATNQTTPAAQTTDQHGSLPTGAGFGSDTDQGQLWSGGDPMKQAAMAGGDALEGSFGGRLLDGVELQLASGEKPNNWAIWDSMSAIIAAGMTGEVTVNMLFGLRPGSVFERVESIELRKLMGGRAPLVTGIKVKRYLREAKGTDGTGKPFTTATSGAVLHEEKQCNTVDEALNAEPYKWERNDMNNPYFAVVGGHTTGAPPAFDPNARGAAAGSDMWGWRKGLEGAGQTPEW
ncbi:MAG: hypothetical protein EP330_10440 [Deltaproteobacteria bacterium]|nr:MAG: hypothetical protein EP330_10440 [Deltaproteobacteria bacterium]